uniref:Uncharacterized protein n=1 Tax=Plectus sambesii TaxID=2011161 RepID=A0A914VYL4_9BILA
MGVGSPRCSRVVAVAQSTVALARRKTERDDHLPAVKQKLRVEFLRQLLAGEGEGMVEGGMAGAACRPPRTVSRTRCAQVVKSGRWRRVDGGQRRVGQPPASTAIDSRRRSADANNAPPARTQQ